MKSVDCAVDAGWLTGPRAATDGQGAVEQGRCSGLVAEIVVDCGEVGESFGDLGVGGAVCGLDDVKRTFGEGLGGLGVAEADVRGGECAPADARRQRVQAVLVVDGDGQAVFSLLPGCATVVKVERPTGRERRSKRGGPHRPLRHTRRDDLLTRHPLARPGDRNRPRRPHRRVRTASYRHDRAKRAEHAVKTIGHVLDTPEDHKSETVNALEVGTIP
jgi:hypothetical protein